MGALWGCGLPSMAEAALVLDPGYSSNMVLQRTTPTTKGEDCILSGSTGKDEEVGLRWPGLAKEIMSDKPEGRGRTHWYFRQKHFLDAGARLDPGGPHTLTFTTYHVEKSWFFRETKRNLLQTYEVTNVWVGDVWIVARGGQTNDVPARLEALRDRLAAIVPQVYQADLSWNLIPRCPGLWRPCDVADLAVNRPVLCYALADSLGNDPKVPLGLIILCGEPLDMLTTLGRSADLSQTLSPDSVMRDVWKALMHGWQQSSNDWQAMSTAFDSNKLYFRRLIQPVPPACIPPKVGPDFPANVFLGTPTNMTFRVRGAFY